MDEYLSVADAARILDVVPATVRQMERSGRLPARRTAGGIRLFCREDVERLAAARAATDRQPAGANGGMDSSSSTAPARPDTD